MLLGVIPMLCFVVLRIFGGNRKSAKKKKERKLGKHGLLRRSVGNPRRGVALRHSVGCPRRGKAEVPKWHPLGYATT